MVESAPTAQCLRHCRRGNQERSCSTFGPDRVRTRRRANRGSSPPGRTPKYKVNRGLTVDQARDVLEAARDERLYALYVLALCLGLRRGELFGLRWEDVDLVPCAA